MGRSLILALALASGVAAQEPTFKTGISIVEIDAQVFDKTGIIDGLKPDDFVVKDDRRPVSLRYCVQEETPLDLVFLLELSKMMAPNRVKLRGAAEAAMAAMRGGDRAGVLSFNEGLRVELPLSGDLKEVKRRVRNGLGYADFGGKPFVLSAVANTAKYMTVENEAHGRRAVLMFGANAGQDLFDHSHISVAQTLWNADAILSAVVIPTSWTRFLNDDNPYHIFGMMALPKINRFDYVDDVAELTGGETLYLEDAGPTRGDPDPYVTLQKIIQRMRRRYRLYYDMPEAKPGQRRHVEIELGPEAQHLHPGARIIGRKGYVVPKREASL
jgi:VWFA-related protein